MSGEAGPGVYGRTVAWGLFAAVSWTWCIGMYLPRIMIERHGWAGFLAFAIPNVIGCAGFGYVLSRPDVSRRLVARHAPAMAVFSAVAIAYQLFFTGYLLHTLLPLGMAPAFALWGAPIGLWMLGVALGRLGSTSLIWLGGAVYAVSLAVFVVLAGDAEPVVPSGRDSGAALVALAPVIGIGFLLCPYLDLTFHRALQSSPSRHAFLVFGLTFSVMLVLTVLVWFHATRDGAWRWLAAAHIVGQLVFTAGAHQRELRQLSLARGGGWPAWLSLAPLLAVPIYPVALGLADGVPIGDDVYIRFLVAYGLLFPLYVLVFMGPWRPVSPTWRHIGVAAAAAVFLTPVYELGFLHGRATWLLTVPVIVVLWVMARGRPFGRR